MVFYAAAFNSISVISRRQLTLFLSFLGCTSTRQGSEVSCPRILPRKKTQRIQCGSKPGPLDYESNTLPLCHAGPSVEEKVTNEDQDQTALCAYSYRGYLFFSVKDRNLFHRVDTISNIFTSGAATSENITDGVHEMKYISIFTEKKNKYSVYFMLLTLSGRSFIKIQYSSFPLFPVAYPFRIATQLQYYVKLEKCKVNDVIFPSGWHAQLT